MAEAVNPRHHHQYVLATDEEINEQIQKDIAIA